MNSGARPVTSSALTWKSGNPAISGSLEFRLSLAASIHAMETGFAWVCAAIFGTPVVPPV